MRNRIRRVHTPAPVNTADAAVASAWGYSLPQWFALDNVKRADCRLNVVHAPYFRR